MSTGADQTPIDFAALAAPNEEHTRLEAFVGKFTAEVKIWMGPGEPMVTTGVMTNSMDLGGRFLRQTYQGDDVEGPFPSFAGRGYWGYNKTDQRWEGFWIDTGSTVMQFEHGQVDESGSVWTLTGEMTDPITGQSMVKSSVITLIDPDHHSIEMYYETPEAKTKGLEIHYRRLR